MPIYSEKDVLPKVGEFLLMPDPVKQRLPYSQRSPESVRLCRISEIIVHNGDFYFKTDDHGGNVYYNLKMFSDYQPGYENILNSQNTEDVGRMEDIWDE